MRLKTSIMALAAAGVLATSGIAFAQMPADTGGSGEHKVGAGPDPKAMPAAGDAMAGDAMMKKPMMKKHMMKKHMMKKHKAM